MTQSKLKWRQERNAVLTGQAEPEPAQDEVFDWDFDDVVDVPREPVQISAAENALRLALDELNNPNGNRDYVYERAFEALMALEKQRLFEVAIPLVIPEIDPLDSYYGQTECEGDEAQNPPVWDGLGHDPRYAKACALEALRRLTGYVMQGDRLVDPGSGRVVQRHPTGKDILEILIECGGEVK